MEDVVLCEVFSVTHGVGDAEGVTDAHPWRWEAPRDGSVAGRLVGRLRAGEMFARVALPVGCSRQQWVLPERVWAEPETGKVWDARHAVGVPDAALVRVAARGGADLRLVLGDDVTVIAKDTVQHRGQKALVAAVVVPRNRCLSLVVGSWEVTWCVEHESNTLVLEEIVMPVGCAGGSQTERIKEMDTTIMTCGKCGRQAEYYQALREGWLIGVRKEKRGKWAGLIHRCPQCITRYALRIVDRRDKYPLND